MTGFRRRVLLVEDDRLLCSSLAEALAASGFEPRCAFSAKEAKKQLALFDPDVVVCDVDLGSGPTGIDLIAVVRRQRPGIVAILLTKHPDSVSAGYDVSDIPDGVTYLRKSLVHDAKALVEAIDQAAKEHTPPLRHDQTPSSVLDSLTKTQRDVLRMMALGLSNQEISTRRGVSVSAVEQRIAEINRKLGITPNGTTVPRVLAIREYITAAGVPKA